MNPMNVAAFGALCSSLDAKEALKKGLYTLKVSKRDATEVERKLQGELLRSWKEKFEVARFSKIKIENFTAFLDHMEQSYEGVTEKVRKKMEGILICEEGKTDEVVETTFNTEGRSNARYSLTAFGRSSDGKFIDCISITYKAEFELAPHEIESLRETSMLLGLINWVSYSTEKKERYFGIEMNKKFENYFRMKVLEELKSKKDIESINYE